MFSAIRKFLSNIGNYEQNLSIRLSIYMVIHMLTFYMRFVCYCEIYEFGKILIWRLMQISSLV